MYSGLDTLQSDVHAWIASYNEKQPHNGRYCYGKTPMQTWYDCTHLAKEKMLPSNNSASLAATVR